jgi:hypothetical protein
LENFAHLGKSQKVSMHKWKFSLAVVQWGKKWIMNIMVTAVKWLICCAGNVLLFWIPEEFLLHFWERRFPPVNRNLEHKILTSI